MTCYPWHQNSWTKILSVVQQGQLTHGWILSGHKDTGREQFAQELAKYLLCQQPENDSACGHCQSCHWFAANTHPDYIVISPVTEGKAIKVDQIRELNEVLSLSTHGQSGCRVVIISPAEAMNRQAANSLLKSLEEPPANTYFFLLSSELSTLPATIRSRCQLFKLDSPNRQQATAWLEPSDGGNAEILLALEITDNAPLAARQMLESAAIPVYQALFNEFIKVGGDAARRQSPVSLTDAWLKQEQYMPINWILRWISVLIKLKQGHASEYDSIFDNNAVTDLLQRLTLQQLFRFYDDVLETSRLWSAPLNRRLQLEGLFTNWQSLF